MRLSATRLIASSNSRGIRVVEPVADVGQQLQRHVLMHAARAEPVHGASARPRHARRNCRQSSRDFEQPQVRRHRADVHDVRAQIEHMVRDTRQLGEEHAQVHARAAGTSKSSSFSIAEHERYAPCIAASSNRSRSKYGMFCSVRPDTRSASRCRDGAGRHAGRSRSIELAVQLHARAAARRARRDAAGRS